MKMAKLSIVLGMIILSPLVQAKRFANQYCEFELPVGWDCALEGSEWVCQSENEARKKEAIIILAAKIRGAQDTLEEYQKYLKDTKTYQLPGGKSQVSEPKYAKMNMVNNQNWVDALHLASEVPGFYTRYLATVKEDLGVAITFSVGKDFYDQYKDMFDKVVASLRVFRQQKADLAQLRLKGKDGSLDNVAFDDSVVAAPEQKSDIGVDKNKKAAGSGNDDLMLIGVGVAVLVGFFVMKNKGKKK